MMRSIVASVMYVYISTLVTSLNLSGFFINKTNLEKDLAMDSLNILAFEERDLLLNQHADKVINCDKKRINQIIGQITKK